MGRGVVDPRVEPSGAVGGPEQVDLPNVVFGRLLGEHGVDRVGRGGPPGMPGTILRGVGLVHYRQCFTNRRLVGTQRIGRGPSGPGAY